MQVIGITGGIGAGKSAILEYMEKNYNVKALIADEIAHELMMPETECYRKLLKFLPADVYNEDETINRQKLAEHMFEYERLRRRVNRVVHPAVKEYIIRQIEEEQGNRKLDYIIIEAALLLEEHYEEICDELWYIYASEATRRKRLMKSRGYSGEKIDQIFASQLSEEVYRERCSVVIDNDGTREEAIVQMEQAINNSKGDTKRMEQQLNGVPLVFGLDIGTRNVVGTVGYKEENEFIVIAQYMKEHDTRSMLDGQIHDIRRVGRTIHAVKRALEEQIHLPLEEVCIAAAGRVLKTVTTNVEYAFPEETVVTGEDIHNLDLLGVEKAQRILNDYNDTKFKFYCVGYSVVKYYLNGDIFSSLESHKADIISEDIIATFLPEDVVDGLYSAVEMAGLSVANMTLEPIAAINVAIPETFRMLNIALVDVGAGTSDICLTKEGSIIAYGMIPSAGDELTELIVQHYLVDFRTAEDIKLASTTEETIEYKDIMMIKHTIPASEVWELINPQVEKLTHEVAEKIKELNGDNTVSATFVVGGGGKVHGFTEQLAEELELPYERVALRGEEVLQEVHFEQQEVAKDPLLVTPVGICLNYYDQKNNFIFVRFNGERVKLYDNSKLTIVDAAMQTGFPNDQLFPKRGKEINFSVNGKKRIVRGEAGEPAFIQMNGRAANINTPLEPNCEITIEPSAAGAPAVYLLEQLEEYGKDTLSFEINGRMVNCPKFAEVNGILEPPYYEIQENDQVEMRNYYTVGQVMEFMDVEVVMEYEILVNNRPADLDTLVYENFSIDWTIYDYSMAESEPESVEIEEDIKEELQETVENGKSVVEEGQPESGEVLKDSVTEENTAPSFAPESEKAQRSGEKAEEEEQKEPEKEPEKKEYEKEPEAINPKHTEAAKESEEAAKQEEVLPEQTEDAEESKETAKQEEVLPEQTEDVEKSEEESKQEEVIPEQTEAAKESEETAEQAATMEESTEPEEVLEAGLKEAEPEKSLEGLSDEELERKYLESKQAAENDIRPNIQKQYEVRTIKKEIPMTIQVTVNQEDITLKGKSSYIFVDVFDEIEFDLNAGNGRAIVTKLNGEDPSYSAALKEGDAIEIYWQEN